MDSKKALELVNQMIHDHKRDDLKSVVDGFLKEVRQSHMAPLRKAIEEVGEELRKVDPHTKLPGTLMDKSMGDMQSNLNPEKGADESAGFAKADPATSAPMLGSEGKKKDWSGIMKMCKSLGGVGKMGTTKMPADPTKKKKSGMMTGFSSTVISTTPPASPGAPAAAAVGKSEVLNKPYASDAQRGKFHAMEARGEISPKVVKEFDQASKGKKLPEKIKKALGGTGMGAPSTPTSKPNAGFGAVIAKDDKAHPPGSPEERSHAVAEGMVSLPKAAHEMNAKGHEASDRFFNHLRSLKSRDKMRSPQNNLTQKSEDKPENQKDMSASAKTAIMEPSDQPMKVQPHRPGQANKPS
jgi:hypothetical protein